MKATDPKRMELLASLVAQFPKLWRWPSAPKWSKNYKHHSDQECERRRGQQQHRNQVKVDLATKRQPEAIA